jgi:hypothetical protein
MKNRKGPLCTGLSAQCLEAQPTAACFSLLSLSPSPCQRAPGRAGADRPNGDTATATDAEGIRPTPPPSPWPPHTLSLALPLSLGPDPPGPNATAAARRAPTWPPASIRPSSECRSFSVALLFFPDHATERKGPALDESSSASPLLSTAITGDTGHPLRSRPPRGLREPAT